jgi:hypothetical protein
MTRNKWLTLVEVIVMSGLAFLWSWVFVLPVCGMFFRCGCTWLWNGGIRPYVYT